MLMFETWQDLVLTVGQLIFFVALLPSVFSKNKPSKWTSLITAVVLISFGFTFFSLGMVYSTIVAVLNSFVWGILYVQKRIL